MMKVKTIALIVWILTWSIPASMASVTKDLKMADQLFEQGHYYDAIDYYQKVLESQAGHKHALYHVAMSYEYARDYKNAEEYYKRLIELADKWEYPEAKLSYADMMKRNGSYEKARKEFKIFQRSYRGPNASVLKKEAKIMAHGCDLALRYLKNPKKVVVSHPGNNINSAYTEISPLPMGDSALIYAGIRSDTVIIRDDKFPEPLIQFFQSVKTGDQWGPGELMSQPINDAEYHTGNGAFSPDGKRFFFSKCYFDDKNQLHCEINVSKYNNGSWGAPEAVGGDINGANFSSTQPAIGSYKDGKDIMFYVSDKSGGRGGKDIWYSVSDKKGNFKKSKNLGRKVNTPKDEITPTYESSDKTLYFSSMGHAGMGGFDLFKSQGSDTKWSTPENMGHPINSGADDTYYVINKDQTTGYLVSNRKGSLALKSETCCDDIYTFEWLQPVRIAVKGYVYREDDPAKTPLKNMLVSLFVYDKDSIKDNILLTTDTTLDGAESFFFTLKPGNEYKLNAKNEGYFSNFVEVSTLSSETSDTLSVNILVKKLQFNTAYNLRNIYYDYEKFSLRDESLGSLDTLARMIRENPDLIIEIGSHTDNRGEEDYNLKLSQKRAESVVKYLIRKGVEQDRLVPKGYGETVQIAPNEHPDGTDNPEGRQLNRRTEFKVLGKKALETPEE